MAYLLINNCTENYWNRATTVKIIVGAWVVYFFATQCRNAWHSPAWARSVFLFPMVDAQTLAVNSVSITGLIRLMPNSHRPLDTTGRSCLCRVWRGVVNWKIAINVFRLQIFCRRQSWVAENPVHTAEAGMIQTGQFCWVWPSAWRCELSIRAVVGSVSVPAALWSFVRCGMPVRRLKVQLY